MKWVITFESKFNVGDVVEYNNNMTFPFRAKVLEVRLTETFRILYKLENIGVLYSEEHLTLIEANEQ
jgi:hypothetical protein